MNKLVNKIIRIYQTLFWSLEKQAKNEGVILGKGNLIASRFWDTEPYLIQVGSNCQITGGVKFCTHGGAQAVRNKFPKFDTFGKIVIGDYVYIGYNSLIMPGVTIGNNVLVAAGSVVTKSVPDNTVVGGNPAHIICNLDEYIKRNLKHNTDTKGVNRKEKKKILLSRKEDIFIKKDYMEFKNR